MDKYVIGLDFGTDSVRSLLVNAITGEEVRSVVHVYKRWKEQLYCDPSISQYRQHPADYVESMTASIQQLLSGLPKHVVSNVVGMSADTTGSTPVAVDQSGNPLALLPEFSDDPDAMFILWKDHTANAEAEEINRAAHAWKTDYTKYSGGIYSSEWFWSKVLHVIRRNEAVRKKAFSWVEHCDWIPALLTGITDARQIKRSRCAAGHKAMWHRTFDGLPSEEFLVHLDKRLAGLRGRLYEDTLTADKVAGTLSPEWASKLGLPENVKIGVGAIDAHFGAVGAFIEPFRLVKVMGTSTCDMLIAPNESYGDHFIKGICGQVDGSIVPGMLGMEAGQSAFGDVYAWFQKMLAFPLAIMNDELTYYAKEKIIDRILPKLSEGASRLPVNEKDAVALDWINGRRTPDADFTLTGAITGIRLDTDASHIFKALVEATAFGSKAIVDRFKEQGVPIRDVIALGGIAKKSKYVMQTLTDVLNVPIRVIKSEQACALGAAMFAATAAGIYSSLALAQNAMASGFEMTYVPDINKVSVYDVLYDRYREIGRAVTSRH